jgi:hypothetical protein
MKVAFIDLRDQSRRSVGIKILGWARTAIQKATRMAARLLALPAQAHMSPAENDDLRELLFEAIG